MLCVVLVHPYSIKPTFNSVQIKAPQTYVGPTVLGIEL